MDDAGDEMEVVDPNAVRKQVSQITSSGWIFARFAAAAEILNNNMLLKSLSLNQRFCPEVILKHLVFR